ncbi:MAG: flagellar biosynthetic protein FliR, partial [Pirellulaceae bacterium]
LLDTFQWRAPGGDDFPTSLVEALSQIVAESFVVGIRAGAPVMVSLLLAVLILGLISRTLPQLNIFAIGFNVNALILLATLAFSLSTISAVVENSADSILSVVRDAIRDG